ncbi:MAG: glycine--tRNA ligase subunit beta [Pseudanabaenaceae cyanobacterium]
MANFLLEVGTEELPASFVIDALRQWQSKIPASLNDKQLNPSKISVYGTPRRLAVLITGLPQQQPDQSLEVKGPSLAAAFTGGTVDGAPTKALQGFLKSKGVTLDDTFVQETDKGSFIYARQQILGRPTVEILQELAPSWITGLEGKRLMRWGNGDLKFPRPIRWLVALLDQEILPIALTHTATESITANRFSQGHRVLSPGPVTIKKATDYVDALREASVIVDGAERRQKILDQLNALGELINATPEIPTDLLDEVTYLVEYPTAITGEFEREFLELPAPVIKTEMVSHQRYFPLHVSQDPDKLLPYFVTISNGNPEKSRLIAAGNGRVIRARLSDGKFFYDSDRAVHLETFLPALSKVTFQEKLGSVADKVTRLRAIAQIVVNAISNLSPTAAEQAEIDRTAALCKADLVSQMVKEFPELQGTMGYYYAQTSGESATVAQGIREHYQPRGAGDALPQSLPGQITAIADRLDTLVGIFGLGIIPTGSSDPFALRRAATGVVQITWENHYALNLPQLLQGVIDLYQSHELLTEPAATVQANLIKWFRQRCETLLQDQGLDYDLVDAVLGVDDLGYTSINLSNLDTLQTRAQTLQQARRDATLGKVYEPVNRATRLASQGNLPLDVVDVSTVVEQATLTEAAEQNLYQAVLDLPQNCSYQTMMTALETLTPVLSKFFDDLLVMAEDLGVRQNRLNLLGVIRNYSRQLADFSVISR